MAAAKLELDYTPPCADVSTSFLGFYQCPPETATNQATTLAGTTLTTVPSAAAIQSPSQSPTPPSPGDPILIPGLRLPEAKDNSKPGRRPAASPSSLSSASSDGRVSKRSAAIDPDIISRRQRNNIAAKRYRQKKIDRIQELEDEVAQVKEERDELRIRLARQEAEVAALREMLNMKK
ncbi:CCAAT/enhancer-binding protein epsilon [Madurella mycetomatis]|uniref:CCAAT/enhancer-binding protein epsilon n=1 Tax=Madurella mycetomatis TaxID=100816 RepID=A0A175W9H7_9PEZI|nr:CCAAT/enhancer-binding protein epsilon [Madurella mycetomatis]